MSSDQKVGAVHNTTQPFAVKVETPLESEYLQRLAFQHGWLWCADSKGELTKTDLTGRWVVFGYYVAAKEIVHHSGTHGKPLYLHADHAEIVRRLSEWGKVEWPEAVHFDSCTVAVCEETKALRIDGGSFNPEQAKVLIGVIKQYIAAADAQKGVAK